MLTAGVDVGSLYTKAVIVEDGQVVGTAVLPTREDVRASAAQALEQALAPRGRALDALARILPTGAGKGAVDFGGPPAQEVLCAARGIRHAAPEARAVVDLGGESTRAIRLDDAGQVVEFALNDKCASGTGVFLDAMAQMMQVPLAEVGPLALRSRVDLDINATCVVFAESEVVSLVHRQTPREDILRGIHRAIAVRIFGLMTRVDVGAGAYAIGGMARNVGILRALEERLGGPLLVPPEPDTVTARGAALLAAESGGAA
jgi:predicted CoA-substrate-specific enzyme activase